MPFFEGAYDFEITGGTFNDIAGNAKRVGPSSSQDDKSVDGGNDKNRATRAPNYLGSDNQDSHPVIAGVQQSIHGAYPQAVASSRYGPSIAQEPYPYIGVQDGNPYSPNSPAVLSHLHNLSVAPFSQPQPGQWAQHLPYSPHPEYYSHTQHPPYSYLNTPTLLPFQSNPARYDLAGAQSSSDVLSSQPPGYGLRSAQEHIGVLDGSPYPPNSPAVLSHPHNLSVAPVSQHQPGTQPQHGGQLKRRAADMACTICRKRKLKCRNYNGEPPCERCRDAPDPSKCKFLPLTAEYDGRPQYPLSLPSHSSPYQKEPNPVWGPGAFSRLSPLPPQYPTQYGFSTPRLEHSRSPSPISILTPTPSIVQKIQVEAISQDPDAKPTPSSPPNSTSTQPFSIRPGSPASAIPAATPVSLAFSRINLAPARHTSNMVDRQPVINTEQEELALRLLSQKMAPGTSFDSPAPYPRPRCYQGTRTTIISKAQRWLHDDQRTHDVFWLHGPSGVGKSTVAQTIAEYAAENGCLGAALFFSDHERPSRPQSLCITLAHQLAVRFPGYLTLVAEQLDSNPDLLTEDPAIQFGRLIVEPLSALTDQPLKRLVILDILDELNEAEVGFKIPAFVLQTLLPIPIIWMICSRKKPQLVNPSRTHLLWTENLATNTEESREDASRFIRARFKEMQDKYKGSVDEDANGPWPSENDIASIVNAASGLFAFATTVLKYIEDPEFKQPSTRLAEVLAALERRGIAHREDRGPAGAGQSHDGAIDILYEYILSQVPDDVWPTTRRLLGVSVHLPNNWPPQENNAQFIANFLGITCTEFYNALCKLHSVLDVPPSDEARIRPLKILHASFRDYLVRPGPFQVGSHYFEPYDGIQESSLRVIGSPATFLVASIIPSDHRLNSRLPIPTHPQADKILSHFLPWTPLDPVLTAKLAQRLAEVAQFLIFSSYSTFETSTHCHQNLRNMLRGFDFNSLTVLMANQTSIRANLAHFIRWTKRTADLHELVRTHSTSRIDDELLSYLERPGVKTKLLDFDDISAPDQTFNDLHMRVCFLMGYGVNTVLVLIDGTTGDGARYHSIKSPTEIWPLFRI